MSDLSNFSIRYSIFILILLALVMPLVIAEEVITIPFNQEYDLKRQCFNNGTYCSSATVCNLTVNYPSGVNLVNNVLMTNQISFYNYTFPAVNISQFGRHISSVTCVDTGGDIHGNGFDTFIIEVTGDGGTERQFPIQIVFGLIGIALIVVGQFKEDLRIFQTFGGIMLMIFGVITLFPGYSGINYSNLMGQGLGMSGIGLGFYFLIERSFSRNKQAESFDQEFEDDGRFHG